MTLNRDEQLAELITTRALDPNLTRPHWVSIQEWEEIGHLASIERDLRDGAVTPPLAQDCTAAMLGLIADQHTQLDRGALNRLRQRAGLSASDLAARLTARGWDVTHREVFRWENQSSTDVVPALIEAIAAVLNADAHNLTSIRTENDPGLDASHPIVRALAERLARALGVGDDMAITRLRSAVAVAVHRGEKPREDQMLATLEGYVRAMERRREP